MTLHTSCMCSFAVHGVLLVLILLKFDIASFGGSDFLKFSCLLCEFYNFICLFISCLATPFFCTHSFNDDSESIHGQ